LETAYLSGFEKLAGDLVRIESFLYPQLKSIVANLVPDISGSQLAAECDRLATMGNEQSQQADGELIERKDACTAARTASTLLSEQLMRLMQTLQSSQAQPGEAMIAR